MYIKDLTDGSVREYGTNQHDALMISEDGRTLSYENLQNSDGSRYGEYRFCDENGLTPEEDEVLMQHGADAYFNIGGFSSKTDDKTEGGDVVSRVVHDHGCELKPCPFCGKQHLIVSSLEHNDRVNAWKWTADILCSDCFGEMGTHGFHTSEKEAIDDCVKNWNRRWG